jgi:hypothetical protein
MTTLDTVILGVCGLALAAVIGYAFWVKIRVLDLQADLRLLLVRLDTEAAKRGETHDPAYRHARSLLLGMSEAAPLVSVPILVYLAGVARKKEPHPAAPKSDNPVLQAVIEHTLAAAYCRVTWYLMHHTVIGGILWLCLRLLPKQVAKEEATEVVERSAEPLDKVARDPHLIHC